MGWLAFIVADAAMLCASNLLYGFSAFKLQLKANTGWDEPTLAYVIRSSQGEV